MGKVIQPEVIREKALVRSEQRQRQGYRGGLIRAGKHPMLVGEHQSPCPIHFDTEPKKKDK